MQPGSTLLLLFLGLSSTACFEVLPEEAAPRRARFSANSPGERLNQSVVVFCMHAVCWLPVFVNLSLPFSSWQDVFSPLEICEDELTLILTKRTKVVALCGTSGLCKLEPDLAAV